jgi:hypothetical protein
VGERGTVENIWQKVAKWAMETWQEVGTNELRRHHGRKGGCDENHCILDRRSGRTNPGHLVLLAP